MRTTIFTAAFALLLVPASGTSQPASEPLAVDWTVEQRGEDAGKVQLQISRRTAKGHWMHGNTTALADLEGLSAADLASSTGTPVRFRMARESGTLEC